MSLHIKFLSDELKAQTEQYRKKCSTSALLLKQKREIFVCQYVGTKNGQLIVKMRNDLGLPRKDEYFLGIVLYESSRHLNNFKNWGDLTWGDLGDYQSHYSELKVHWMDNTEQEDISLLGLGRADLSFTKVLTPGCIIILGPQKPPREFLKNLFQLTHYNEDLSARLLYADDFRVEKEQVTPLDNSLDIFEDIAHELEERGQLVILGPPGTGKTYLISQLCVRYLSSNKTVMVTALTNRALIEVAGKKPLEGILNQKKVYKTNLSQDEIHELPHLQSLEEVEPKQGSLILTSFYTLSKYINSPNLPKFDCLIVDEASQALLAMLQAVGKIGRQILYVGDTNQLSAVCALNEDVIKEENYRPYQEGLATLLRESGYKTYLLSKTRRLNERAARYTSIFYGGMLKSAVESQSFHEFAGDEEIGEFFHPQGGPTWIRLPLEAHQKSPESGLFFILQLICKLKAQNSKLDICILSYFKDTVSSIQTQITGTQKGLKHLLIDTVSRVQGKTCDICVYFIPDYYYYHACSASVFNVATSRARMHTIIISSEKVLEYDNLDQRVRMYLTNLKKEFSFEFKSISNFG